MLAFRRICETLPSNVSRGRALTVKCTICPTWIEPMSVSLTDDQISRRLRSLAIRKRLGAFRPADDLWPMFTRRSRITPLTGERIVVYPRLTVASSRSALATASAALGHGEHGLGRLVGGQRGVVFLGRDHGRVPAGASATGPARGRTGRAWRSACSMSASALATRPRAWSTRAGTARRRAGPARSLARRACRS